MVDWKVFGRRWLCLNRSYPGIYLGEEKRWGNRKNSFGLVNIQVDKTPEFKFMVLQMAR